MPVSVATSEKLTEEKKRSMEEERDLSIHMHTHTVTSFPSNQITFSMIVVAATAGPLLLLPFPIPLSSHPHIALSFSFFFSTSHTCSFWLSRCHNYTFSSIQCNASILCALHARQTRMPIITSSEPGNCNQTVREVSECRIDCKVWGCKINNLFIGFK